MRAILTIGWLLLSVCEAPCQIVVSGGTSNRSIVVSGTTSARQAGFNICYPSELAQPAAPLSTKVTAPEQATQQPPARTSSLPTGWSVHFWTSPSCGPCRKWQAKELPKLAGCVRVFDASRNRAAAQRINIQAYLEGSGAVRFEEPQTQET
jgi:hypothetical protein